MNSKINFDFKTTHLILQVIGRIDNFKGKWHLIEREENIYLKELKKLATLQSIGSSTRIEGSTMTDEEIQNLLKDLKINKLETRDEQEVVGYFEALEVIFDNYSDMDLTERNIFTLHGLLLKESVKDQSHRGQYKQHSNKVVATYPDGTTKVVFNTTAPFLTRKEMEDLLHWCTLHFEENTIHPLILIGTFVYEFLSIHPFQDGNGRLSRLLTTLLLLRSKYDFIQYISFEHLIEERKKEYYKALMAGQKHRYTEKEVISEWMLFFLGSLEILISKLDAKYDYFRQKGPYLELKHEQILSFIKEKGPTKISDVAEFMSEIPINTLKKDLKYLVTEGVLIKIGERKTTRYILKNENK